MSEIAMKADVQTQSKTATRRPPLVMMLLKSSCFAFSGDSYQANQA
jgi:hypothetical protein